MMKKNPVIGSFTVRWLLLLLSLLLDGRCIHSVVSSFSLQTNDNNNIRLNKVFRETYSRRQADALIANRRVMVNGEIVQDMGRRVIPYQDIIHLDGTIYTGWERHNRILLVIPEQDQQHNDDDVYIKFWKPIGITSTTDTRIPGNLLQALQQQNNNNNNNKTIPKKRIFSVGRLDKDSSGLLLLTSDGRLPNAVLAKQYKQPKTYRVRIDKPIRMEHVQQLRQGIVITTDTVRSKNAGQGTRHVPFTAKTLPCQVRIIHNSDSKTVSSASCELEMTLIEGRNRQIRIMLQTLGYTVLTLHRTHFLGMDLSELSGPGDWTELSSQEQELIQRAIQLTTASE
jgi:pseudouridine synthase